MSTVDEILSNPSAALELSDGSIPVHIIVIVEYVEPGSDNRPSSPRLAWVNDDNLPPWTSMGMLDFARQLEIDALSDWEE